MLLGPDGAPLERKKTYSLDELSSMSGFVRYGSASGMPVTPETAVQVPAVLCAVRVLAEGISQMPIRLLAETYEGDRVKRTIARSHWAHKLIARKPNEFQTSFEFREYAMTAAVLDKGFLGIKNTLADGRVTEILPVPMGSWTIERDTGSWEHYFRVSYANGTSGVFKPSQCVYFRGPTLDGWRALPALQAAREAIGLAAALEKQQARLAGNGGKPSGILSFSETLSPERRDKLRELWAERFGPNGEGGIAVLDSDAKFASMTMTSVDAQTLESRKNQIEEVARAFRVHPIMLMLSNATTTFASAEQHFRNHVIHSLNPWAVRFEQVLYRDVLEPWLDRAESLRASERRRLEGGLVNVDDWKFDLDERGLMRGDFADQAEYYTKALGSGGQPGWMTVNEIRAERDMNAFDADWADEVPQGAMMQPQTIQEDIDEAV